MRSYFLIRIRKISMPGYLEMIIGPMFSGKTTMLIQKADQYELCNQKVLMVNHCSDVRYGTHGVFTHGKHKKDAVMLTHLSEFYEDSPLNHAFHLHDVICVDEGQFFDDLSEFAKRAVNEYNKHIIVSCLHGTYNLTPFNNVCSLLPFCDLIRPMRALCMVCKDGTKAPFTRKTCMSNPDVGGEESYVPVCRKCYG